MADSLTILGSGLAAYQLARHWRENHPNEHLTIISQDNADFYSKPMLSNAISKGKTATSLVVKSRDAMAKELNANILANTLIHKISIHNNMLYSDHDEFSYEKLVLAQGADPFIPPFSGSNHPLVFNVNNIADYEKFRQHLDHAKNMVILGGGLIGCEFANDIANLKIKVHMIDLGATPLGRLLPEKAGQYLANQLESIGIETHWNTSIKQLEETENGKIRIILNNNVSIEADLLLSAVGLKPRIQLAKEAGLATQRGILVNRMLQTSNENIYAIGDCCEVEGWVLPYLQPITYASKTIVAHLNHDPKPLVYPAMPVVVKTPVCPVVVCPVKPGIEVEWKIELLPDGMRALAYHEEVLHGFALLGKTSITEKNTLAQQIPDWLA